LRNRHSGENSSDMSRTITLRLRDLIRTYSSAMATDASWDADGSEVFDTPEAAALAGWNNTPSAHARVVHVGPAQDPGAVYVYVQLDVDPPGYYDQDIVTCCRTADGKWFWSGSTGGDSV
jgi:hypothetical protein